LNQRNIIGSLQQVPAIKRYGHTWEDYLAEFHLTNLEISTSFISKYSKTMTLIRMGDFSVEAFNPIDQYKNLNILFCVVAVENFKLT
jgi:hypothetical protein